MWGLPNLSINPEQSITSLYFHWFNLLFYWTSSSPRLDNLFKHDLTMPDCVLRVWLIIIIIVFLEANCSQRPDFYLSFSSRGKKKKKILDQVKLTFMSLLINESLLHKEKHSLCTMKACGNIEIRCWIVLPVLYPNTQKFSLWSNALTGFFISLLFCLY